MPAVFNYAGGKSRAIQSLQHLLDEFFPDAQIMYSPYMGGGSFELHCINELGMTVYGNDLLKPLAQFWRAMRTQRTKLGQRIQRYGTVKKAVYVHGMGLIRDASLMRREGYSSMVEEGALFYAMITSSFSGSLGHYSAHKAAHAQLSSADVKLMRVGSLQNLNVQSMDGVAFLRAHPRAGQNEDSVIFLDPPYALSKDNLLYGVSGALHRGFDHAALRDELGKRSNWMLCYNDTPFIRKLYRGYTIRHVSWQYTFQAHRGSKGRTTGKEICIVSVPTKSRTSDRQT